MRMVSTVSPPTSGDLEVLGMSSVREGREIRARLGVVPQDDNLDTELTVRQNLVMHARFFGVSRADAARKADELLDFAQLTERADARVDPLSGGMKRRLTIARSLVNDPELVLLDEPTTGLDPQARHLLWERLYRLKEAGVTLLLTTHYMDEAEQLSDRLVVMDGGKIVAEGSPAELIARHTSPEVLELRFAGDRPDFAAPALAALDLHTESLPDRVLIYADKGDEVLRVLRDRGVEPTGSFVRRSTLEDVFLALTGRRLAE